MSGLSMPMEVIAVEWGWFDSGPAEVGRPPARSAHPDESGCQRHELRRDLQLDDDPDAPLVFLVDGKCALPAS